MISTKRESAETKGDAESLLGSEYVGGWRSARRLGYRVARVEIREIKEGQDDDHNRSNNHEH